MPRATPVKSGIYIIFPHQNWVCDSGIICPCKLVLFMNIIAAFFLGGRSVGCYSEHLVDSSRHGSFPLFFSPWELTSSYPYWIISDLPQPPASWNCSQITSDCDSGTAAKLQPCNLKYCANSWRMRYIEAVIFSTADADYYRLVLFRFQNLLGDNLSTDTKRHYRRRKLLFEAGRLLVSCVSRGGY